MRIMIAKSAFSWVHFGFVTLFFGAGLSPASDDGGGGSLSSLTTTTGKVYHDVRVVKADPNGLLFRHRGGSAKIPFSQLDSSIQAHYHYNEIAAEEFENVRRGEAVHSRNERAVSDVPAPGVSAVSGVVHTRGCVSPLPKISSEECQDQQAKASQRGTGLWLPPHPLVYAAYPWRQLAERDFLIATGILPAPAGVRPLLLRRW